MSTNKTWIRGDFSSIESTVFIMKSHHILKKLQSATPCKLQSGKKTGTGRSTTTLQLVINTRCAYNIQSWPTRHYRTSDCLIQSSDSTAMAAGSWSIGCAEKSSGPRRMKKSAGYNTRLLSRAGLVGSLNGWTSALQQAAAWFVVLANEVTIDQRLA